MMNLKFIMPAHECHSGSTAAFIFTSSRATRARQSSWLPRNPNEVASTHLSTPSTGVHRSFSCTRYCLYFVLHFVLLRSCLFMI
jgi:hypothetical protein